MKITDDMLTEWFPAAEFYPIHDGEYETRTGKYPIRMRRFQDGGWWFYAPGIGWLRTDFKDRKDSEFRGLKEKHHG